MKGVGMINQESRVFWYSVTSSCLLIIVLKPPGVRPLYFWCFVEILLWGGIPVHGQYLCWWICIAQLSSFMSGMICGSPWISLRLNLILVFPLWLVLGGNDNLAGLCWWSWTCPCDIRIICQGCCVAKFWSVVKWYIFLCRNCCA